VPAQFVQDDIDRRRIFAQPGPAPVGYGPLTLDEIRLMRYPDEDATRPCVPLPAGTHPLDDYYTFYGYPPQILDWVAATPPEGYDIHEVVQRLGLDVTALFRDSYTEALMPDGATDAAGDPLFLVGFGDNWAVANLSGQVDIDPRQYRFKAWVSLHQAYLTRISS